MFWLFECGGADFEIGILPECVGNAAVHAFGINVGDDFVFLFVGVFTPDGNAKFLIHIGSIRIPEKFYKSVLLLTQSRVIRDF